VITNSAVANMQKGHVVSCDVRTAVVRALFGTTNKPLATFTGIFFGVGAPELFALLALIFID
jgi:hypothetical protein